MTAHLRRHAAATGASESQIVRDAIERHLAALAVADSAYELARRLGLAGCAKRLPRDLSVNGDYFAGFGSRP